MASGNFRLNLPSPQINFNPAPQPNFIDSAVQGFSTGQSLGLRARQMALLQEEAARQAESHKQKIREGKLAELKAAKDLFDSFDGVPTMQEHLMKTTILPNTNSLAKEAGLSSDIEFDGIDLSNKADKEFLTLINKHAAGELDTPKFVQGLQVLSATHSKNENLRKRANEAISQTLQMQIKEPSSQFVGAQGGQGVVFNPKAKTFESIPFPEAGPLTPKNMTEGQSAAALFGARGADANQQLENLIQGGFDPTALEQGVQKILPNYLQGENAQALEQIGKNFVAAVLRKESGAAINAEEWRTGRQQYIPQTGDKPKILMQKAINRQRAIQGFALQAGNVSLPSLPGAKSTAPTGPRPGAVMKGYRFKGGNPADKSNWVKQ